MWLPHYLRSPALDGVAGPTDPNFANVSLLVINDNKGNTTTSFIDQSPSPKTMTAVGNAQYSTGTAPTGMTSSMLSDGAGDGITTPNNADFDFGSGNFTIEGWLYTTTNADLQPILMKRASSAATMWLYVLQRTNRDLRWFCSSTGASWDIANSLAVGTPALSTWTHWAVVRNGVNFTPYLNGAAGTGTASSAAAVAFDTSSLSIGLDSSAGWSWTGNLCSIRLTKGVARYTGAFSPPTLPLPSA